MKTYVAYYRVSTTKQGESGLGLESQRQIVKNHIGGNNLIAEFTEIESGKRNNRPELQKAIQYANQNNATLIISKLDRLSRNITFIFQLKDSNVDFECCDIPQANTMTIGIFALLAQQERELISERTKKALSVKKQQGIKLGTPANLTNELRAKGRTAYHKQAIENDSNKRAFSMIKVLREQGNSYRNIATQLNESGFQTPNGKTFSGNSIRQIELMFNKQMAGV